MEIQGKVSWVGETTTGVSQKGNQWTKREFVVEYEGGEYPKRIKFDVVNDDIMGMLAVGVEVKVQFSINVRVWNGRMFNDIRIWPKGLEIMGGAAVGQPAAERVEKTMPEPSGNNGDDLPF